MSHSLSHIHTRTHKKVPGEIRHGSLFVLSNFYLPQPHIELRIAQFGETTALSSCMWILGSGQAGFSGTFSGRSLSWLPHHICTGGQCPGAVSWGGLGMGKCAYTVPRSRQAQNANASLQLSQKCSCLLLSGPSVHGQCSCFAVAPIWASRALGRARAANATPLAGAMHAFAGACGGAWLQGAGCARGGARVPANAQLSLACFTLHWLLCTCTKLPTVCSKCQDLGPLPKLLPSILQFQTWIPLPTALSTLII